MWRTISRMCGTCAVNEPCDDDFFDNFKCLDSPEEKDYFVDDLEHIAKHFLKEYDHSTEQHKNNDKETKR